LTNLSDVTTDGVRAVSFNPTVVIRSYKCIKERIQAGNKAYYASLLMLKSKSISRRSQLQIYKTLIRPIVTYGAETWTLTLTEENALKRFETKVLRKIDGPVMDKVLWRIRYNFELYRFMGGKDIDL
jgi:hypothetical protein